MKCVGIQIDGNELILVVLKKDEGGVITQTDECTKFGIADHTQSTQVRQFLKQVTATLDALAPNRIGIIVRNANAVGSKAPSPVSFKLEGILQLYSGIDIEFIWPQSITSHYKKNALPFSPQFKYQQRAFELACFLLQ